MPILIVWALLTIFWIFAIYSVSIYESFQITLKMVYNWALTEPSNYFYFFKQIKNLLIGLVIAAFLYKLPLSYIQKYRNKIFIWALIFQLLVFTPLWTEFNWALWWLYIKWVWTVQPSEFFKIWFVTFMSGWFLKKKKVLATPAWFIWFLFVIGIFFFIFLKIPDLWTLLVLGPVALIMYWYVGWRLTYIIVLTIVGLWLGLWIWMQFNYVKKRLEYYINPEVDVSWRWVWWQIQQALTSIWWGWWIGKWYWKWLQKFWYIPEAQSDFIFAAFSEEIWFIWNSILLTLYFLLAYHFLKRLPHIKNEYIQTFWIWLISVLMIQVFVNIWVNTKILPLTWLTLPFISFWWTALMVNFIELILLYKIINDKQI